MPAIPEHEIQAAKVDAFLSTQGIILTAWQRQLLERMFADREGRGVKITSVPLGGIERR